MSLDGKYSRLDLTAIWEYFQAPICHENSKKSVWYHVPSDELCLWQSWCPDVVLFQVNGGMKPQLQGNFFHGRRLLCLLPAPPPHHSQCPPSFVTANMRVEILLRQVMDWNPTWDLLIPILAPFRGLNNGVKWICDAMKLPTKFKTLWLLLLWVMVRCGSSHKVSQMS